MEKIYIAFVIFMIIVWYLIIYQTEELRKSIANAREKAQKVGQPMFDTFLQRGINDRARRRVEVIF